MTTGPDRLEDRLQTGEQLERQRGELRPAMIDDRARHGAQDAIGNVRGTGDLEKVPAGLRHDLPTSECSAWVMVFCASAFTI